MANKFIDNNPMLKKPALALLGVCVEHNGASRAVVEEEAARIWPNAVSQSVASVLDALVRVGCLSEQIVVDGQPYEGTLEDVYRDKSVGLDADVDALISITEEGLSALSDYKPETTLAALLAEKAEYETVFQAALLACNTQDGASREVLEQAIESAIADGGITAADGGRIYPQYFIDALESAGGIEWHGAWRNTTAGAASI